MGVDPVFFCLSPNCIGELFAYCWPPPSAWSCKNCIHNNSMQLYTLEQRSVHCGPVDPSRSANRRASWTRLLSDCRSRRNGSRWGRNLNASRRIHGIPRVSVVSALFSVISVNSYTLMSYAACLSRRKPYLTSSCLYFPNPVDMNK